MCVYAVCEWTMYVPRPSVNNRNWAFWWEDGRQRSLSWHPMAFFFLPLDIRQHPKSYEFDVIVYGMRAAESNKSPCGSEYLILFLFSVAVLFRYSIYSLCFALDNRILRISETDVNINYSRFFLFLLFFLSTYTTRTHIWFWWVCCMLSAYYYSCCNNIRESICCEKHEETRRRWKQTKNVRFELNTSCSGIMAPLHSYVFVCAN